MTDTNELAACPFCGGMALLDCLTGDDSYFVQCAKCEIQQIANYTRDQAIERWNSRAALTAQRAPAVTDERLSAVQLEERMQTTEGQKDILRKFHSQLFSFIEIARSKSDFHAAEIAAYFHDQFCELRAALDGRKRPADPQDAPCHADVLLEIAFNKSALRVLE
ncbi:MAG: restriction alleviation protein, Lar family [Alphaproteobacteria bacterium]|nr:restriction alleviation protein, Lar family [Alphaproteobacteria bacterium]